MLDLGLGVTGSIHSQIKILEGLTLNNILFRLNISIAPGALITTATTQIKKIPNNKNTMSQMIK